MLVFVNEWHLRQCPIDADKALLFYLVSGSVIKVPLMRYEEAPSSVLLSLSVPGKKKIEERKLENLYEFKPPVKRLSQKFVRLFLFL